MKRLIVTGILMAVSIQAQGITRYVSLSGSNTAPYTNWATAAREIQDAVNVSSGGDAVLVTNGTYLLTNQISITKSIIVRSVNGSSSTTVNGNYPSCTNRCFYINNSAAVLDGFTVTNAYIASSAFHGAGILVDGGGTVINCIITGNRINYAGVSYGGGIYLNGGVVSNCQVLSNVVLDGNSGRAGGIYLASGLITQSRISNNNGGGGVGGVELRGGGMLENCTITDNTGGRWNGGGVLAYSGNVRNCLIAKNTSADTAGGVHCAGVVNVVNCTIVSNYVYTSTGSSRGGGIYFSSENGTATNCIIYFNRSQSGIGDNYSGIATNIAYSCSPLLSGSGNISSDPSFTDPNSNYHLLSMSPCIDKGVNRTWMTGTTDLDGNPRIINGTADIGAYEFNPMSQLFIWTAVEVGWTTVMGSNYQVQYTTNLCSSNWLNFGVPIMGNGFTNSILDSTRTNTCKFYRVVTVP